MPKGSKVYAFENLANFAVAGWFNRSLRKNVGAIVFQMRAHQKKSASEPFFKEAQIAFDRAN